jgi:hypothetical protein
MNYAQRVQLIELIQMNVPARDPLFLDAGGISKIKANKGTLWTFLHNNNEAILARGFSNRVHKMGDLEGEGKEREEVDADAPAGWAEAGPAALGTGFVPLGKLRINMKRLHQNVVHLRHPSGSPATKFPTKLVSPNVAGALRSMAGGKLGFSHIEALSPDERRYIHKVANATGLIEKLDIPAPKSDAEAQMSHRFEVLKGEIMAGNDSPELTKEFKILILKLSEEGLLPKGEVRGLLLDLLRLGH